MKMISLTKFLLLFVFTFIILKITNGRESAKFGTIEKYTYGMTNMVPYFVRNCIKEVEKRGLKEDGLYYKTGNVKMMKKVLKLHSKKNVDLSNFDIHDIIGALKTYLRTLYGRIINRTHGEMLISANEARNYYYKEKDMKNIISDFQRPNRDTLAFLILHMQKVLETPETNLKSSYLASVFGQTLFSNIGLNDKKILKKTYQRIEVVEELLKIPSSFWKQFGENSPEASPIKSDLEDSEEISDEFFTFE
ncbi:GTPase-activating protein RacGAP84C-like [Leptopilina boulardi]|uniref:GTPase-activating protein RacGAP84C-like n=1 Tax=Leptopilina boulardi TaxID=63433 RepID=UPI0021F5C458|nr:GTPase-activating protein RacGAP84C-like [Leptopilina boulardi]